MDQLSQIHSTLDRIEAALSTLASNTRVSGAQVYVVEGLSDISEGLGLVKAGEFRSGHGIPNFGFTGIRMGSPGWIYDNTRYAIVGVNNDVLQFGLSNEDGNVYAGEGRVRLNQYGIQLDATDDTNIRGSIIFRYTDVDGNIKDIAEFFPQFDAINNKASISLTSRCTEGNPWTETEVNLSASRYFMTGFPNTASTINLRSDGRMWLWSDKTEFLPNARTSLTDANDSNYFHIYGGSRWFIPDSYGTFHGCLIEAPTWTRHAASGATTVDLSATMHITSAPILQDITATKNVALAVDGGLLVTGGAEITGGLTVDGTISGDLASTDLITTWVDYSATSTITGWSSYTVKVVKYARVGRMVYVLFSIQGTSNTTAVSFTLPYTAVDLFPVIYRAQDNGGSFVASFGRIASDNTMILYPSLGGGSWTGSGTKSVIGQFWYMATT